MTLDDHNRPDGHMRSFCGRSLCRFASHHRTSYVRNRQDLGATSYHLLRRGNQIADLQVSLTPIVVNGRVAMLRIGVQDEKESTSFIIEGKLTAPWAPELEKCWRSVVASEPSKLIIVNLASVTFIDITCRELLTRMRRQGVKLVPTGCLMKAIVEQIEADVLRSEMNL